MALTIPRAGTLAGAAASIRVATPQVGDAIAQLGDFIQQKQLEFRQQRQQIDMRRTQLDITREMGAARQEVAQMTDPDEIDQTWMARSAEIRAKYLGPDENGNPRYDEDTAAELDLAFTELNDKHALAVGNHNIAMRQSQREAAYVALQSDILARAATADPETLDAYVDLGTAGIEDRLRAGTITPEQAARERAALGAEIYGARAAQMIEDDPAAFLAATTPDGNSDNGPWNALGPKLADYRLNAEREVKQREAAALKAGEAAVRAQNTALVKRLGEMSSLMGDGFRVEDEALLSSPAIAGNPDPEVQGAAAAAMAAQTLRDENPGIRLMTPAQLDAQIAAEMARPVSHRYQTERVAVLKKWRDEMAAQSDTDYVGLMRRGGMVVPDLPEFDPADPEAFAAGLVGRMGFDQWAREGNRTRTQAVFSADERARLKPVLDPKADVAPKLALAQSMLAASGGKVDRLAGAAGADPVFTRAARLMAATGNVGLAEEILRGQQRAASDTVNLPSKTQMTTVFNEIAGPIFEGGRTEQERDAAQRAKEEILQAAMALYANDAGSTNPDGADSAKPFISDGKAQAVFGTAIQRVLGARADRNGALAIGGLQTINEMPVWLPPGVAGEEVEMSLNILEDHLRGKVRLDLYGERSYGWDDSQPEPDRMRAFKAASLTGRAPNLGNDPARRFGMVFPHRVGESDVFELRYVDNGRTYTVPEVDNPRGTAWRFRLPDLMREAAK